MRELWAALWKRISRFRAGSGDRSVNGGESMFEELSRLYAGPGRYYHTLAHIGFCLSGFDSCSRRLLYPESVETAIWFHDAVYDPASSSNELQSAALAEKLLADAGFDRKFTDGVSALVCATTHADGSPLPFELMPDVEYLLDLDLAVLGSDLEFYDAYVEAIRKEFSFLSDDAFRAGRASFLGGMLARSRIYLTDEFGNRFEERARSNITRELSELASRARKTSGEA